MNPDALKMSMHATFLAAALALHALAISARPIPEASLPIAHAWIDAAQEASVCAAEDSPSGYLGAYSSLLAATAGGDGGTLASSC